MRPAIGMTPLSLRRGVPTRPFIGFPGGFVEFREASHGVFGDPDLTGASMPGPSCPSAARRAASRQGGGEASG